MAEKLDMIIKKWQSSSFLADAMLADYAKVVSQLTNMEEEVIKDRIITDANQRLSKFKEKLDAVGEQKIEN